MISFFLLNSNIFAQVISNDSIDEHNFVYWFHIKMRMIENNFERSSYSSFQIIELKDTLMHGNSIDYQADLFRSLKNGIIPIGPFNNYDAAWKTKLIYEHKISHPNIARDRILF